MIYLVIATIGNKSLETLVRNKGYFSKIFFVCNLKHHFAPPLFNIENEDD